MKTIVTLLFLVLLGSTRLLAQTEELLPISGQYIVELKPSAATPVALQETTAASRTETALQNQTRRDANLATMALLRRNVAIPEENVLAVFADVLVGFSARLSQEEVTRLLAHPDVAGVYQDYYIQLEKPTEETTPEEFLAAGQITPCAITNAGGFKKSTSENWIWILDTGIDVDHPDLKVGDLFPYAKSFIPGESYNDANGHGTHLAGIAAAKNNTFGIVGVSAGALVIPVKVLANSGLASLTYLVQGLNHVAIYDSANDVVCLGVASYPVSNCSNNNPALKTALLNLSNNGTWVCMSAGNNSGTAAMCAPGCINGARILTVGSITCAGGCASGTNWGPTVVDWVATGANVYSTHKNGGYSTLSGTAQAAAVVAGIIHARGDAPVTGGTINCGNQQAPPAPYKKAKRS